MVENVRIKLSKADATIEIEGDKKFVEQTLERFLGLLGIESPQTPSVTTGKKASEGSKPLSPSEYIRQTDFKTHTDIVLAFGYYLEKFSDFKDFVSADINRLYYEAKLEASNTSQMIIQNIRRGFIMEAKKVPNKDKRFTLTQTGMKHVEERIASHKSAHK